VGFRDRERAARTEGQPKPETFRQRQREHSEAPRGYRSDGTPVTGSTDPGAIGEFGREFSGGMASRFSDVAGFIGDAPGYVMGAAGIEPPEMFALDRPGRGGRAMMEQAGMIGRNEPQTDAGRSGRRAGELTTEGLLAAGTMGVAGTTIPALSASQSARALPTLGRMLFGPWQGARAAPTAELGKYAATAGPAETFAAETAASYGGGVGAVAAPEMAPEYLRGAAEVVGGAVGGVGAAFSIPWAMREAGVRAANAATRAPLVRGSQWAQNRVHQDALENAPGRLRAAMGRSPDDYKPKFDAARKTKETIEDLAGPDAPGLDLNLYQITGNTGASTVTRDLSRHHPAYLETLADREAANLRTVEAAFGALAPSGAGDALTLQKLVAEGVRRDLDWLDNALAQFEGHRRSLVHTGADTSQAGEAITRGIRESLWKEFQRISAHNYSPLEELGDRLMLPTQGWKAAAKGVAQEGGYYGQPEGGVARVLKLIDDAPDHQSFAEIRKLRTKLNGEISLAERAGDRNAVRQLGQLKASTQKSLDDIMEGREFVLLTEAADADTIAATHKGARLYDDAGEQKFIDAWHGSPHNFDAFDMAHMGTGEGAQAYGYGHYVAEAPEVAGAYKRERIPQRDRPDTAYSWAAGNFLENGISPEDTLAGLRKAYPDASEVELSRAIEIAQDGHLYRVRVNAAPEDLLDWDAPLSEQGAGVREKLEAAGIAPSSDAVALAAAKTVDEKASISMRIQKSGVNYKGVGDGQPYDLGGREIVGSLNRYHINQGMRPKEAEEATSALLREAGIPGHRYFDRDSRGAGEGTRNIVAYSDDILEIVEKNGKPVTGKAREDILAQRQADQAATVAGQYKHATSEYKAGMDVFGEGTTGKVSGKGAGKDTFPASEGAAAYARPGKGYTERAKEWSALRERAALQGQDETLRELDGAMQEHLSNDAYRAADFGVSGKRPSADKLSAWKRKNAEMLNQYPETRQQLDMLENNWRESAYQRGVAEKVLGLEPADAIDFVLKRPDSVRVAEALLVQTGNDPDALAGLRRGLWERLTRDLHTTKPIKNLTPFDEGRRQLDPGGPLKVIDENRPLFDTILGKRHTDQLRKVLETMYIVQSDARATTTRPSLDFQEGDLPKSIPAHTKKMAGLRNTMRTGTATAAFFAEKFMSFMHKSLPARGMIELLEEIVADPIKGEAALFRLNSAPPSLGPRVSRALSAPGTALTIDHLEGNENATQ
jgi:hypothetical protein